MSINADAEADSFRDRRLTDIIFVFAFRIVELFSCMGPKVLEGA
jgi:hypothetical protein